MQILPPHGSTEELFISRAMVALPTIDLEIGRNDWGILYYRWSSPSAALGDLWVSVKEHEITLSTNISHTHVASVDFRQENLTQEEISRRIVDEGVSKAAAVMRGEIAFTETFNGNGKKHSSGSCHTENLEESLRYTRQMFGQEMTKRAFTWFGEVSTGD